MALRQEVFVVEQNVSEEIERDGQDHLATTLHFIGRLKGRAIASGRILGSGKIGRVCVLKEFRGQKYGEVLLRAMLVHALETDRFDKLYLHAQVDALNFYTRCGFVAKGEEFVEANIRHKLMTFNARSRDALQGAYQDRVLRFDSPRDCSRHLAQMAAVARHQIDILTLELAPAIYSAAFGDALSAFARGHRRCQVRILVQDTRALSGRSHPVVSLARRLPSSVRIRKLTELPELPERGFALFDGELVVLFNDERNQQGFANYRARAEARQQLDVFEPLWQYHSEEDPNLSSIVI
jgi:predicted GNAT family N-acyltransferase